MDFSFSFKSSVQGVFYEEWEIKTEPFCLYDLERVKFTGMASGEDKYQEKRKEFLQRKDQELKDQRIAEMVNDILENVKTPVQEGEDLSDPEIQRRVFEDKNKDKNLYYSPLGLNWFKYLEQELARELNLQGPAAEWNLDVKVIRDRIDRLRFDEQRDFLEKIYQEFLDFTKLRPYVLSPFYPFFEKMIGEVAAEVVDIQKEVRAAAEVWDIEFNPPTDQMTTQELDKLKEDKEKVKIEYLKKAKKKKWTADDEKQALETVQVKVEEQLKERLNSHLKYLGGEQGDYIEHLHALQT